MVTGTQLRMLWSVVIVLLCAVRTSGTVTCVFPTQTNLLSRANSRALPICESNVSTVNEAVDNATAGDTLVLLRGKHVMTETETLGWFRNSTRHTTS